MIEVLTREKKYLRRRLCGSLDTALEAARAELERGNPVQINPETPECYDEPSP